MPQGRASRIGKRRNPVTSYGCMARLLACAITLALPAATWSVLAVATVTSVRAETPDVPVAREARVAGDEARTRFIMDLSSPVEFAVSTLSDPYRIVIDLPRVAFDLPETAGQEGRGLLTAWRFGMFAANGLNLDRLTG